MGTHDTLVNQVVHLQLTSPNFAEYCVAHSSEPSHRFLLTDDDSSERRLYVHLLAGEARKAAPSPRAVKHNHNSNSNSGVSPYVWSAISNFFSTPHAVHGPHMPHMFRTHSDLDAFIGMLDDFQHDRAVADKATQYMLSRLPMTETFLYVLWYRCDELVNSYYTAQRRGEVAVVALLHAAGSMLFIASVLLMNHRASPGKRHSYAQAFDFYLLKIVETLARTPAEESTLMNFMRETIAEWSAGGAVASETIARMNQLVAGAVKVK